MQKYVLLMAVVWCGLSGVAQAATATLAWDPAPGDGAAGYRLYYGTNSGAYTTIVDTGKSTEHPIKNLLAGKTYYFVVRAYDHTGLISDPSNEVSLTVPIVVRSGRLTYDPETGVWSEPPLDQDGNSPVISPGWVVHPADFNGDGFPDLFFYHPTTGAWYKAIDNQEGTYTFFGYKWATGWTPHIVDFDGDGRSDVFLYNKTTGKWFRCLTIGNGDFGYVAGAWAAGWDITPADFNGNGRSDLFLYNRNAPPDPNSGMWFRVLTDGAGNFSYLPGEVRWATDWEITPADFNGNGRSDLFLYRSNGQWFRVRFEPAGTQYVAGLWASGWKVYAGNFEGDRRSELFLYSRTTGQWFVVSMNPQGVFQYRSGLWAAGWTVAPADFNRNGRTDLLLYNTARGDWFEVTTSPAGAFTYKTGIGEASKSLSIVR
jgi:hypothetical protein